MKKLRKIDNSITTVCIWSCKIIFIAVIWGAIVKITSLSFMMELGEKSINVTNQMIMNGTFIALTILAGVIIVCTILDYIVCHLMKIKRRKMQEI